jgi:hypothetical protein
MNLDFDTLILKSGKHATPEAGMCIMEAVAYVAGEPFSDHPACACPVLGGLLRGWNDSLDDENRQRLKPYIVRLIGTNDGNSKRRAWMCADWLVRECVPAFLDGAGLRAHAGILRALTEITDIESLALAQPELAAARDAARATAAMASAWDLTRAAAARTAEWVVASAAARCALNLAPLIAHVQDSAFSLLDRMLLPV